MQHNMTISKKVHKSGDLHPRFGKNTKDFRKRRLHIHFFGNFLKKVNFSFSKYFSLGLIFVDLYIFFKYSH